MEFRGYSTAELFNMTPADFERNRLEMLKESESEPKPDFEQKKRLQWRKRLGLTLDELDMDDLCGIFAGDVATMINSSDVPGAPLNRTMIRELPHSPAVYWLVTFPSNEKPFFWPVVYVGQAADLYQRWNGKTNPLYSRAVENKCLLNWRKVSQRTAALVKAAMIYRYKPAWNFCPGADDDDE